MKKIVCSLWALTVIITSCNEGLEVEISPVAINYNTVDCSYYGSVINPGTALFILNLYDSSNPNIGIIISGFCTMPNSFANFKLNAGTYNNATNGALSTYYPGIINDGLYGTYLYNKATNQFTQIIGGNFNVAISNQTYTISTNFIGVNTITGVAVTDIVINFTGQINLTDESGLKYGDIVRSTYTATGTPKWLDIPGPNTWSGTIEPVEEGNEKKYKILNWANRGNDYYVYCKFTNDGRIIIDVTTRVAYNDTYDGYFHSGFLHYEGTDTTFTILRNNEYEVNYNKINRILDFTGTVTDDGIVYPVIVGIAAFNKTTGDFERVFSEFYADLKLHLTPIETSSRSTTLYQSENLINVLKNERINHLAPVFNTVGKIPKTMIDKTVIDE